MNEFWSNVFYILLGTGFVIGMILLFISFLPIMLCISIIIAIIGLIGCILECMGF